eukprot:954686-Amphidinium_carterae.1
MANEGDTYAAPRCRTAWRSWKHPTIHPRPVEQKKTPTNLLPKVAKKFPVEGTAANRDSSPSEASGVGLAATGPSV